MAKQFKIYFSKSTETVTDTFDKDIGEVTISIRQFEIELLITLFSLAARFQAGMDAFECKDIVDELKNLTDKEKFIELTDSDLKYGKTGWAKSVGSRNNNMIEYGESIIGQLYNPFDPDSKKKITWDEDSQKFKEV